MLFLYGLLLGLGPAAKCPMPWAEMPAAIDLGDMATFSPERSFEIDLSKLSTMTEELLVSAFSGVSEEKSLKNSAFRSSSSIVKEKKRSKSPCQRYVT